MSIWDYAEDAEINAEAGQIRAYGEAAIAMLTWGVPHARRGRYIEAPAPMSRYKAVKLLGRLNAQGGGVGLEGQLAEDYEVLGQRIGYQPAGRYLLLWLLDREAWDVAVNVAAILPPVRSNDAQRAIAAAAPLPAGWLDWDALAPASPSFTLWGRKLLKARS